MHAKKSAFEIQNVCDALVLVWKCIVAAVRALKITTTLWRRQRGWRRWKEISNSNHMWNEKGTHTLTTAKSPRGEWERAILYITGKWNTWSKKAIETAIAAATAKPMGIKHTTHIFSCVWVRVFSVRLNEHQPIHRVFIISIYIKYTQAHRYTRINAHVNTCHAHMGILCFFIHIYTWSSRVEHGGEWDEKSAIAMRKEKRYTFLLFFSSFETTFSCRNWYLYSIFFESTYR